MGDSTAAARAHARRRNREHIRRTTLSDITPEQELAMRKRARTCPMCGVRLTSKLGLPNSKHLDHIIPIAVGGTHTHGNVRIICASCNLRRPRDGSDYSGPVTLWAQGPVPVRRPDRRANMKTCRKGLHPWIPANIKIGRNGRKVCRACRTAHDRKNPLRNCKCGTPFAAPGSQAMCPACIGTAAREAARLHATGLTWRQIAAQVGYGSGEGARFAARRIGYIPAPKVKAVPAWPGLRQAQAEDGKVPGVHRGQSVAGRGDETAGQDSRRDRRRSGLHQHHQRHEPDEDSRRRGIANRTTIKRSCITNERIIILITMRTRISAQSPNAKVATRAAGSDFPPLRPSRGLSLRDRPGRDGWGVHVA